MKDKIDTLFDYIKNLCESDLNRIINFVLGIVSVNQMSQDRPECPYCGGTHVIKYGHRKGKQRFWCHDCRGMFHLNTVNSLHSYIKDTYEHYRGVATKYINRYNALFSLAFRCTDNLKDTLFSSLCTVSLNCYWHGVKDIRNHKLVVL